MHNITTVADLRLAIQILEADQVIKEQLLKEQFHLTYRSLRPVNLIKSIFNDSTSSPSLIDNIFGSVLGMASGYISKKIVVGGSDSILRKMIGTLIQLGVTKFVTKNPETIKSIGHLFAQKFFNKKT